jgi:Uma2 family endonuclease
MVQTELTLDDLEQMPDDAMHRELVNGELIELPPSEQTHIEIAKRIFRSIDRYCLSGGMGVVFTEAGYKVTDDGRNWIQPDVSVVNRDSYTKQRGCKYLLSAPDIAVEIISPSERPKHIRAKRDVLFRAGCKEIWVVRPKTQTVEAWTADGATRTLAIGDTLTSPVLQGWSMTVSEIFGVTE